MISPLAHLALTGADIATFAAAWLAWSATVVVYCGRIVRGAR